MRFLGCGVGEGLAGVVDADLDPDVVDLLLDREVGTERLDPGQVLLDLLSLGAGQTPVLVIGEGVDVLARLR
jgi:hypothetical protein